MKDTMSLKRFFSTILVMLLCTLGAASQERPATDVVPGPQQTDSAAQPKSRLSRMRPPRPKPKGVFSSLDSALLNIDSVEVLILRDKGLTALPPQISQMKQLRSIDLSGNKLAAFPPQLLSVVTLVSIDVTGNPIKLVPDKISQLTNLVRLNLKNTGISSLPPTIGQCKALSNIDVSQNPLLSLPIKELNLLPNLRTLHFGNPQP